MGAHSAGGGAPGRGETRTDSAKAKIKAATLMIAGLSLITVAIVHWNTAWLDRAARHSHTRGTTARQLTGPTRLQDYMPIVCSAQNISSTVITIPGGAIRIGPATTIRVSIPASVLRWWMTVRRVGCTIR